MPTQIPTWVDAGPFRAHLRLVMADGRLTATEVAVLVDVPARALTALLEGRRGRPVRRISPATARALLQLDPTSARNLRTHQVPAAESRLRLQRLLRHGDGIPALAERLGLSSVQLAELADEETAWCSALVALRLLTACRALRGARPSTPDPALADRAA